jgi:septum formation protein
MMAPASLWRGLSPLILASGSVTRRVMLENCQIPLEIVPADIDERLIEQEHGQAGAGAVSLAVYLAQAKALAVSQLNPLYHVLGCDQVLMLNGESLHKQSTMAGAFIQLQYLSGKTHTLTSAASLVHDGAIVWNCEATTAMTMRTLSDDDIHTYLEAAGPVILSSVGCYQIESLGTHLFDRIEGDHFTILGLPLLAVLSGLRQAELLR